MSTSATLDWYVDVISPFAWLQWQRLGQLGVRERLAIKPVLLAGLLSHHGQRGPAEIPSKRDFTYQHVQWLAQRMGLALRFPPAHPFNPLPALRLIVAAGSTPIAVDAVMGALWREGRALDNREALRGIAADLGIVDLDGALVADETKARLRANGDSAIAAGVFGVPTLVAQGRVFWGLDATDMALEYVDNPTAFESDEWRRLRTLPMAAQRRMT